MSRRARWVIGCVVLVVVVVGGCVALAYFALGYSYWKNCWFPPHDPDVEIVVSACREPMLLGVSPDGRFVTYGTQVNANTDDTQGWLLDVVSGAVQPDHPGCGMWLTSTLRLGRTTTIPVPDPLDPYPWEYIVCDMSDDSRTPLQWVQTLPGSFSRLEDGTIVFSPEVAEWFRNAEQVYYDSRYKTAIALAPDFKAHPEGNYILAPPRGKDVHGHDMAIQALMEDNEIAYTEIAVWNQIPRSHDGRFTFQGTTIVDSAGTEVANYEYEGRWWGVSGPSEAGWAYGDSGVYFQLGRGGGGLFLFSPPGPIQPILKLKVPEEYLQPTPVPAP